MIPCYHDTCTHTKEAEISGSLGGLPEPEDARGVLLTKIYRNPTTVTHT
jgi:hypothetical protein